MQTLKKLHHAFRLWMCNRFNEHVPDPARPQGNISYYCRYCKGHFYVDLYGRSIPCDWAPAVLSGGAIKPSASTKPSGTTGLLDNREARRRIMGVTPAEATELTDCLCHRCMREHNLHHSRFYVCPTCGNKRCPHASDHDLACTNSNLSGQPGSLFL